MTLKTITEAVDQIWAWRKKPLGWLVIAAALLVLAAAAYDKATAEVEFRGRIQSHLERAPKVEAEAVQAWKDVKAELQTIHERQMHSDAINERYRQEWRQDIRDLRRSVERSR